MLSGQTPSETQRKPPKPALAANEPLTRTGGIEFLTVFQKQSLTTEYHGQH